MLDNKQALEALLMIEAANFNTGNPAIPVQPIAHIEKAVGSAADLYWLAFLLTGRRDISIDIAADGAAAVFNANPFFTDWMRAWSRRIVIAKALAESRDELAASARRTRLASLHFSAPLAARPLNPETSKADIEEALLSIDAFPRAAVVLVILESVPIADAATLLDADVSLVRKAQAIGLRELTAKLGHETGSPLSTSLAD